VLHLATHGFFLGGACESALSSARGSNGPASTPAARLSDAPPPIAGENPLVLSGLALAGANHRSSAGEFEDDGILTAEEVASLDLSGVEWAVLSACETGVGDVRPGEGVFGLRRAFQIAGAHTLIMSLWSVDADATRSWMKALYEARLARHLGTAESVRAASLKLLNDRRAKKLSTHPFYWAGFVAAGDWR
jgi:CHAT domain-containing protein